MIVGGANTYFSSSSFFSLLFFIFPMCVYYIHFWILVALGSNLLKMEVNKKDNDILKFVGKWMDLENNIVSEVTQTQKTNIICAHS